MYFHDAVSYTRDKVIIFQKTKKKLCVVPLLKSLIIANKLHDLMFVEWHLQYQYFILLFTFYFFFIILFIYSFFFSIYKVSLIIKEYFNLHVIVYSDEVVISSISIYNLITCLELAEYFVPLWEEQKIVLKNVLKIGNFAIHKCDSVNKLM